MAFSGRFTRFAKIRLEGAERLAKTDPEHAAQILAGISAIETSYRDRILPIDAQVAPDWAARLGAKEKNQRDRALAARARPSLGERDPTGRRSRGFSQAGGDRAGELPASHSCSPPLRLRGPPRIAERCISGQPGLAPGIRPEGVCAGRIAGLRRLPLACCTAAIDIRINTTEFQT